MSLRRCALLGVLLLVLCQPEGLAAARSPGDARLRSGVIGSSILRNETSQRTLPSAHRLWGDYSGHGQHALVFDCSQHRPDAYLHLHTALAEAGIQVLAHVPGGAVLVLGSLAAVAAFSHQCLQSMSALSPSHKVSPEVQHFATHWAHAAAELAGCDASARAVQDCPARAGAAGELVTLQAHFVDPPGHRPPCPPPAQQLRSAGLPVKPLNPAAGPGARSARCQLAASEAFALAAAADWADALAQLLGLGAGAVRGHRGHLEVDVLPGRVQEAAQLLAEQTMVSWVALRPVTRFHDWTASSIIQSGSQNLADANFDTVQPFWAVGLRGAGQIVGIGDSGMDVFHCAFSDSAVAFGPTGQDDYSVPYFQSDVHRKVALYYMFQDAADEFSGHGSHTTGIIAAAPPGALDDQSTKNGMAPEARLAFFDLGSAQTGGLVSTPGDLNRLYYPVTYGTGARVHTDSWGSNPIVYDSEAASLDRFTFEHPDFMIAVSAGNYGQSTSYQTTVNSPALAKNSLALGNSQNTYTTGGAHASATPVTSVSFAMGALRVPARLVDAEFGPGFGGLQGSPALRVVAADPITACSALSNGANVAGAVVLIQRGTCQFKSKALAAQAAGAAGVLIGNLESDTDGGYLVMSTDSSGSAASIPVASIPGVTFRHLQGLLLAASELSISVDGAFDMSALPAAESLDTSSSFGPTNDGRIKPDVVAPGTLTSVKGGSACEYTVKSGTSMSSPAAAGAAAIVRQYFSAGFYPGGTQGSGAPHEASGTLVKAVIIGGAHSMLGFGGAGGVPMATPSGEQGWGRVSLSTSLPLTNVASTIGGLSVVDLASLSAAGESHKYCLQATGGPLTVTLVWHDYPASPAAGTTLVNDLDLSIRAAVLGSRALYSNGAPQADRVNNVERIRFDAMPAGDVSISVTADFIHAPSGGQSYALVVQGAFSGQLQSTFNPAVGSAAAPGQGCALLTAQITSKPESVTSTNAPTFKFITSEAAIAGPGFECQLVSSPPANIPNVTHDWRACTSPIAYAGVPDGSYSFSVRIAGDEVSEPYSFAVDATPPTTTLEPASGPAGSSLPPVPLPPPTSASQVVALGFSSSDVSPVTHACTLTHSGPALDPTSGLLKASTPAYTSPNAEYACHSPEVFYALPSGSYMFSVLATDSVGNRAAAPQVHAFTVQFAEGTMYTRILQGVWGPTTATGLVYTLQALQGSVDGAGKASPAGTTFEHQLSARRGATWVDAPWQSVAGNAVSYESLKVDGPYRASFRTVSSLVNQPTAMLIDVDTTPPVITVVSAPPAVVLSDSVRLQVSTNEEGVTWHCALLPASDPAPDAATLGTKGCDVQLDGSIDFAPLVDGQSYTVYLQAVDPRGNQSPISTVFFLVDASPPTYYNLSVPAGTRATSVSLVFGVQDGPSGTGVDYVNCGLRWLGAYPDANISFKLCEPVQAPEQMASTDNRRLLHAPRAAPARQQLPRSFPEQSFPEQTASTDNRRLLHAPDAASVRQQLPRSFPGSAASAHQELARQELPRSVPGRVASLSQELPRSVPGRLASARQQLPRSFPGSVASARSALSDFADVASARQQLPRSFSGSAASALSDFADVLALGEREDEGSRRRLLQDAQACPGCAWYRMTIDTAEEGRWGVTVSATDGANQTNTTPEAVLTVDRAAPSAIWAPAGIPRSPSPSTLTFAWTYSDTGAYQSGEDGGLCLLSAADSAQSAGTPAQDQANADTVLLATDAAGAGTDAGVCEAKIGAACVVLGSWQRCPSPATYSGLPSGEYMLRAMPVDAAGNVGNVLDAPQFEVDATIPLDQAQRVGGGGSMSTWVYAAVGGAALLLVVVIVVCVWLAARRRRRGKDVPEGSDDTRGAGVMAHVYQVESTSSGRTGSSEDMQRALEASRDAARMEAAIEASRISAALRQSVKQPRYPDDDEALRLAISMSLNQQQPSRGLPAPPAWP